MPLTLIQARPFAGYGKGKGGKGGKAPSKGGGKR